MYTSPALRIMLQMHTMAHVALFSSQVEGQAEGQWQGVSIAVGLAQLAKPQAALRGMPGTITGQSLCTLIYANCKHQASCASQCATHSHAAWPLHSTEH